MGFINAGCFAAAAMCFAGYIRGAEGSFALYLGGVNLLLALWEPRRSNKANRVILAFWRGAAKSL